MIAASSTSPSPLLTKEGNEDREIVNKLLNTYKEDNFGQFHLLGAGGKPT